MLVGLLLGVVSTIAYGCATVLQSVAARRVESAEGLDPRLLVRAIREWPYLVGVGLDIIGFAASVVALQTLPLFVVQSLVAASVGVTALIAVAMGARLGPLEWASLGVMVVGLVLLGFSAGSEHPTELPMLWRWVLLGLVGVVAVVGLVGARLPAPQSAVVLAFGSGLGFAAVAVCARTLVFPNPLWHILTDPILWALAAHALVAMLLFTTALQRGAVTSTAAVSLVVETVLPAGIGLAFLGDTARHGFAAVAIAGFVLAVVGAVSLARFTELPEPDTG